MRVLDSSQDAVEIIQRCGGIFNRKIADKLFSYLRIYEYLKHKKMLEYVVKGARSEGYIYKLPDKYIRKYFNIKWKKEKVLTAKGELELRKRVTTEKKKNGLKGRYFEYQKEQFFLDIYNDLINSEKSKKYWKEIFNGLNEHYIYLSYALQLFYISDRYMPYTKENFKGNFPKRYAKYNGRSCYFSQTEDDYGNDINVCIIIDYEKPFYSIVKLIEKIGLKGPKDAKVHFFILTGRVEAKPTENNKNPFLERIKKYTKVETDKYGNVLRKTKNYLRSEHIEVRYYPELTDLLY